MYQRSLRYHLYPSRATEARLLHNLELCRRVYNKLLELKNNAGMGRKQLQAMLPILKERHPELNGVNSKVLQMVNHQLHSNICALAELRRKGRRIGRLRFKGSNRYRTLNFNQSGFKFDQSGKKLVLSKVGGVNIKLHRPIEGKAKGVLITHAGSGKWFAIFQVEEDEPHPFPPSDRAVGIDVGLILPHRL